MNRIEKIKRNIEKAKYLWSEIKYYISSLEDSGKLIGIKSLGNKLKVSKNTIKKYVRLALEDKIKFFQYIALPSKRDSAFPLGITAMIAESYISACKEREVITNGKKTRITFNTFIEDYKQEYVFEGIVYAPKRTYIIEAIKFYGLYSQLCTHKTKQSARFKNTKLKQYALENETIIKSVGLEEELKICKKELSQRIKNAPLRNISYLAGTRVEIDASKEYWGIEQWTVYTAIDSSTGYKVAEHTEKEETNLGYLRLLKKMFERYGKPQGIITDKRRGWDGKGAAQIRDFLEPLGIELFASSDPNAKPKVERSFRTMENDFYYRELKKRNAFTLKEAEKYMDEIMDEYNLQYNKTLDYENSSYIKLNQEEWDSLKVEYSVKFKENQTMKFMGIEYGLADKSKRRIYHRPMVVKVWINAFDEMYVENLNYRLYLDKDWEEKKVAAPTKRVMQQLSKDLNNLPKSASQAEIKSLTEMIKFAISPTNNYIPL